MMKKTLFLAGGALAASVLFSGCAGVGTFNGAPQVGMGFPNIFSEVSGNGMLHPFAEKDFKVIKRNVVATAEVESYFSAFTFGDASFATLKAEALKQAPGADELINIRMDYSMRNILGINKVTVTMTATAIATKN